MTPNLASAVLCLAAFTTFFSCGPQPSPERDNAPRGASQAPSGERDELPIKSPQNVFAADAGAAEPEGQRVDAGTVGSEPKVPTFNRAESFWKQHLIISGYQEKLEEDYLNLSKGWVTAAAKAAGEVVTSGTYTEAPDMTVSYAPTPADRLVVNASNGWTATFFELEVTEKGLAKGPLLYGSSFKARIVFGDTNLSMFHNHRDTTFKGTILSLSSLYTVDSTRLLQGSSGSGFGGSFFSNSEGEIDTSVQLPSGSLWKHHSRFDSSSSNNPQSYSLSSSYTTSIGGLILDVTSSGSQSNLGPISVSTAGTVTENNKVVGTLTERQSTPASKKWLVLSLYGDEYIPGK